MQDTRFGITSNTTTFQPKASPSNTIPEVKEISDDDLRRFFPTGITAKIPTPFVKISTSALFGINVDGFVPQYSMSSPAGSPGLLFANLFPIQVTEEGKRLGVQIVQEMGQYIAMINYLSHRFIGGNVGIGIRASSNTAITGNFYVSQASGMLRDYYGAAEKYKGLRFLNGSDSGIDYAQSSFINFDMSLNRNLSVTPISRCVTQRTDLAMKLYVACDQTVKENVASQKWYNNRISQFAEDWLMFTPVSDFSGIAANQISFTFFFDYSRCTFSAPMLAMVPYPPYSTSASRKEVFSFSATFNDKEANVPIADFKFLPFTPALSRAEQERRRMIRTNEIK